MANGLVTPPPAPGSPRRSCLGTLIDRFDWPTAFLISSGLTLVVALVWTVFSRPPASVRTPGRRRRRGELRALGPLAGPAAAGRGLHRAQLYRYGYFQYLFFYWIQYYFETTAAGARERRARVFHDDHARDGRGHARRGLAVRSLPRSLSPRNAPGVGARPGDDRQRDRLRAGTAGARRPDDPGGVHRLGRLARGSARRASGRRSSSWATPSAGRPPG